MTFRAYCCAGHPNHGEALLDMEKGAGTVEPLMERYALQEMVEMAGARLAKFVMRGFLIFLWVHLFNSMKKYAVNYIGEDTWFCTLAVIVAVVPITEAFCNLGQSVDDVVQSAYNTATRYDLAQRKKYRQSLAANLG
ncbi:hypothetical protein EJB05_28776 [Eragrostis curvula]|uniref:Uncharacterized protein n=1 Tax=Eragrostis curvula TaxID=38414 RepID=A0A5J9UQV1_9POAL|nr:hypothetical protein EJB05_51701 [Eragrostis curvula]TVU26239.1 hypothetical protein EJB05_28776 [Eragrostis curvula]